MFKKSKKGVVEILSFVLITFLIVVASLTTYIFAKSYVETNVESFDLKAMENQLKVYDRKIQQISVFNGSQTSIYTDFKSGVLSFEGDSVIFRSLVKTTQQEEVCFSSLCYFNDDGFESVKLNISNYSFDRNLSLRPGDYIINFKHNKNENTIEIKFN